MAVSGRIPSANQQGQVNLEVTEGGAFRPAESSERVEQLLGLILEELTAVRQLMAMAMEIDTEEDDND